MLMNNERGTITIYLLIIAIALLVFIGLLVDLARIRIAQNQLRRVADTSARSVMANYNPAVRTDFKVFSTNSLDANKQFARYINANISNTDGKTFNLLDYRYESSNAYLMRPLSDNQVLKRQLIEEMKYKAPIEVTEKLLELFRPLAEAAGFFKKQNEKAEIVESTNQKFAEINDLNDSIEPLKGDIRNLKTELKAVNEAVRRTNDKKELKYLQERRRDIKTQMRETKEYMQKRLVEAEELSGQIDKDVKELKSNNNLEAIYKNENNKESEKISSNVDTARKDIEIGTIKPLEDSAQQTKNEINKANKAVHEVTIDDEDNEGCLSQIQIPTAKEVVKKNSTQSIPAEQGKKAELKNKEQQQKKEVMQKEQFAGLGNISMGDGREKTRESAKQTTALMDKIFTMINIKDNLLNLRDEIYVNEYILQNFSSLTSSTPKGSLLYNYKYSEAEYVLNDSAPRISAIGRLYITRLALDTIGYFTFSKTAPPELLARTIYAVVLGALQASVDTYELLNGGSVGVVEIAPSSDNPLDEPKITYLDHLRLFLLIDSVNKEFNEKKLERIKAIYRMRSNVNTEKAYTLLSGNLEVSIKMWFFPIAGVKNKTKGPFGTEIKNGRCYITKEVEFGY